MVADAAAATTPASWRADPSTDGYDAVRARVVEAAERWVERHGINRVRIEEIAEEAGCSRATIYRYFADRDAHTRSALTRVTDGSARVST